MHLGILDEQILEHGAGYEPVGTVPERASQILHRQMGRAAGVALTAARPYRDAMPLQRALAILEKDRGTAMDGRCIDALLSFLKNSLTGEALSNPDYVIDAASLLKQTSRPVATA